MKKIVLTEKQVEKLMSNVLDEQVPAVRATEHPISDGRYHQTVVCDIETYRATYKNGEIDDIDPVKFNISYLIDIDHESYGIQDILVYDIRGPKQIKTNIAYYPWSEKPDNDDTVTEPLIIDMDWKKLDIDKDYEMEYFGVDKEATIYLMSNGQEGLKIKQITITIKQF
jgi:hypothetical protein